MGDQRCCKPGLMCLTELHSKVWVMAWAMPGSSQNYESFFFPGALHSTAITNAAYAVASQLPVDSMYIHILRFWKSCKKKVLHAKKYPAAWWLTESFGDQSQSGTLEDITCHKPKCLHLKETLNLRSCPSAEGICLMYYCVPNLCISWEKWYSATLLISIATNKINHISL